MKRTAAEAFAGGQGSPAMAGSPAFQPNGAAMFDPKAYFQQWQAGGFGLPPGTLQVPPVPSASSSQGAAVASTQASVAGAAAAAPASELLDQLRAASAVRCAGIVKDKLQNFTTVAKIEALHTMAVKSSFKHREELVKQPHVRKLANQVLELARRPPPNIALPQLAKAVWSLTRMPDDVRGDGAQLVGPAAKALAAAPSAGWDAETASKILWCLGRTESIYPFKQLVSKIIADIIKDKGQRIAELSHQGIVDLLFAVGRARQHNHKGDHRTVHIEENDETLFNVMSDRVRADLDTISVQSLADLIVTHHEVGLRREGFFKMVCPRILKDQKNLREDTMAKVIKAYTRFMIPLKDAPQGFRTMAVVAKGDFMRPSDKPKRTGKKEFDKPVALFPKTQVHARA